MDKSIQSNEPSNPHGGSASPTIADVMSLLELPDNCDRLAFAKKLQKIRNDWLMELHCKPYLGTPGEQRDAIRKLRKSLKNVLNAIDGVTAEFQVAIPLTLGRDRSANLFFPDIQHDLELLMEATMRFDLTYKPAKGPKADIPLEEAVRAVTELFAEACLPPPEFSRGRGGVPAKLRNPPAEAMALLLLSPGTVLKSRLVNMMWKVSKNPVPTESMEFALFRTDPDAVD